MIQPETQYAAVGNDLSRWLLKHVHGVHHRLCASRAIAGHSLHPVEYRLTGLIVRSARRGSARTSSRSGGEGGARA